MNHYDLAVIGGGPAGYHAAWLAAAGGMKTALFESEKLGGVCLNEGCIPTKVMLNSSKLLYHINNSAAYGVVMNAGPGDASNKPGAAGFSLSHEAVAARKEKIIRTLVGGVRAKLKSAGAEVFFGGAEITGRGNGGFIIKQTSGTDSFGSVEASNILIATGSSPVIPPIKGVREGLESGFVLTSREALSLAEIPRRLIIVGGGVIGLELADYFNAAGANVTVVEMQGRAAYPMDTEIADILVSNLQKKGVGFRFGCLLTDIHMPGPGPKEGGAAIRLTDKPVVMDSKDAGDHSVHTGNDAGGIETLAAGKILISVGRKPNASGFGADKLGVCVEKGAVVTDDYMRTNIPGIYAAGDVNGKLMLAHTAYLEAGAAVSHMLGKPYRMRYGAIPSVIYTDPEAASVGETGESAEAKGLAVKTVTLPLRYSGRYVAETEGGDGICKVVFDAVKSTVAGVHIAGTYASEIILSAAMMVDGQWPVETLKQIAYPHPTVGEILREAVFEY